MGNDGCVRSYLVTIAILGVFGFLSTLGIVGWILVFILSWVIAILSFTGGSGKSIDYGINEEP